MNVGLICLAGILGVGTISFFGLWRKEKAEGKALATRLNAAKDACKSYQEVCEGKNSDIQDLVAKNQELVKSNDSLKKDNNTLSEKLKAYECAPMGRCKKCGRFVKMGTELCSKCAKA